MTSRLGSLPPPQGVYLIGCAHTASPPLDRSTINSLIKWFRLPLIAIGRRVRTVRSHRVQPATQPARQTLPISCLGERRVAPVALHGQVSRLGQEEGGGRGGARFGSSSKSSEGGGKRMRSRKVQEIVVSSSINYVTTRGAEDK